MPIRAQLINAKRALSRRHLQSPCRFRLVQTSLIIRTNQSSFQCDRYTLLLLPYPIYTAILLYRPLPLRGIFVHVYCLHEISELFSDPEELKQASIVIGHVRVSPHFLFKFL